MLREVIEIEDLLDDPSINGERVAEYLRANGALNIETTKIEDNIGSTNIIKIKIPGANGLLNGGTSATLGVIGTLAGLGARPVVKGIVSDADGAIAALSLALKLLRINKKKEILEGDVVISTHICASAPTEPHEPLPFVGSPVGTKYLMSQLIDRESEAVLSIDTTKGNRVINYKGICISPTVKEGYILKVSDDLLDIMQNATGRLPFVFSITMQDITPYENGLYHLNTIMQPSTVTTAPVVGVAITTEAGVPGCATGANHLLDISMAAQFSLEVAKLFTEGKCNFYDKEEFDKITHKYGKFNHLQD